MKGPVGDLALRGWQFTRLSMDGEGCSGSVRMEGAEDQTRDFSIRPQALSSAALNRTVFFHGCNVLLPAFQSQKKFSLVNWADGTFTAISYSNGFPPGLIVSVRDLPGCGPAACELEPMTISFLESRVFLPLVRESDEMCRAMLKVGDREHVAVHVVGTVPRPPAGEATSPKMDIPFPSSQPIGTLNLNKGEVVSPTPALPRKGEFRPSSLEVEVRPEDLRFQQKAELCLLLTLAAVTDLPVSVEGTIEEDGSLEVEGVTVDTNSNH